MSTEAKVEDVGDFYEHEKLAAEVVCRAVRQRFAQQAANMSDTNVQRRFASEVQGRCGDEGLLVEVDFEWDDPNDPDVFSPTVSDDPNDNNIYYVPRVRVVGRVNKVPEFDHDRQKHEVRAGTHDGIAGVVDVNTGQMKDEPKKQVIL